MRILDNNETLQWLNAKKILSADEKINTSGFLDPIRFSIPVDAGIKANISKNLISFISSADEAMLWINEFGIWPSCEIWPLFNGFRKSIGEHAPLYEKPGHVFSDIDGDMVVALLGMVLFFYWGAILASPSKNLIIKISHDEWLDIYAKDKNVLCEIEEVLRTLI